MNNKYTKELCHSQFQGDELYHHGILGMHWGIRRYQPYPDGYKGDGKYIGNDKNVKNLAKKIDKTAQWGPGRNNPHWNELIKDEGLRKEISKSKRLQDATKKLRDYESKNRQLVDEYAETSDPGHNKYQKYNELLVDSEKAVREIGKQILKGHYDDPLQKAAKITNRQYWMENVVRRIANDQYNERRARETAKSPFKGFKPSGDIENLHEKTIKTKDGKKVTITAWSDVDLPHEENAKKIEKNIEKIKKVAAKFYAEQEYKWLTQPGQIGMEGLSKSDIANMLEVTKIGTNGMVDLTPKKGSPLSWALPYVEIDIDTGKPLYAATDD